MSKERFPVFKALCFVHLAFCATLLILYFSGCERLAGETSAAAAEPEAYAVEVEPELYNPAYERPAAEPVVFTHQSVEETLAKLVYGEARGCSDTERAAVVWCVLNRVDAGEGDIVDVATAEGQFVGYCADHPVDPEILAIVQDVLMRWRMEDVCVGYVGRVLPADYLWLHGDGTHNHFRNAYTGGSTWDWSLPSPYGEGLA